MKTKTILSLFAALFLSGLAASAAPFVRGQVIYADLNHSGYDADWGFGVVGGSFLDPNLVHEVSAEVDWLRWDVDAGTAAFTGAAKHHFTPVLANYRYHFRNWNTGPFSMYIGASVGLAHSKLRGPYHEEGVDDFVRDFDESDWGFVYGANVGFGYALSRNLSLDVGYRILEIEENDFGTPFDRMGSATVNMGYVGVGYQF